MKYDITYCMSDGCPFQDCERHPSHLQEAKEAGHRVVSIADFSGVCRRYIAELVEGGDDDEV